MRLTLATIALNEQDMIGGMLSSVKGLVDDIVVGIDSKTVDGTAAIVHAAGGRTFQFDWCDDFSAVRNLALDMATGDWTLVIDPDERLTLSGQYMVSDLITRQDADGFMFESAQCDLHGNVKALAKTSTRLFRNDPNIRYRGVVHEEPWRNDRPGKWIMAAGFPAIQHFGYCPERWVGRGKHELYLRLLEKRVAEDPTDEYARYKLAQERRMDASGMVLA